MNRKHVVSVLMANEAGALARVVGLIAARGFNIDSLNVAPTQEPSLSRLTLSLTCDERFIEQLSNQLNKLIDVVRLAEIRAPELIDRELMVIKIVADAQSRGEYLQLAEVFRGRVVDICPTTVVIELTGSGRKLDAFLAMIDRKVIRELARTGVTGLAVTGSGKCLEL